MSVLPSGSDWLPAAGPVLSDTALLGVTLFFFGLTLWMIVEIILVRLQAVAGLKRDDALTKVWEGVFFAAVIGDEVPSPPPIGRRDGASVLKVWNHVANDVAGSALARLGDLARRIGLDQVALGILRPPALRLRNPSHVEVLLALRAAERLALQPAWERLKEIVRDGPAPLDRYAARALVALDPRGAAPAILPVLIRQGRWARHLVEDLFEAGAAKATDAYAQLLETAPDEAVPGLALLLDRCNDRRTLDAVRARLSLATTQDPEAAAALLNTLGVVGGEGERELIRTFADHELWFVRMRAAQALGQCGDRRDAAMLEQLLCDQNWYTRYHAARALLRIAELGEPCLAEFADRTQDLFARDMALHVLAEATAPAVR